MVVGAARLRMESVGLRFGASAPLLCSGSKVFTVLGLEPIQYLNPEVAQP